MIPFSSSGKLAHLVFAHACRSFLIRCIEAIFPVRRFPRGKSANTPWFLIFYQMRYALTLGNSGAVSEWSQGRCCFLGSYEVFWSDFLPMRCFMRLN
jgi:hypothetical protein